MNFSEERGSALIDFIGFGIFLQIPLLMFAMQISALQADQLIADSISRHALRSYMLQDQTPQVTANQVLADFGISSKAQTQILCEPDCLGEGSVIRINVTFRQAASSIAAVR